MGSAHRRERPGLAGRGVQLDAERVGHDLVVDAVDHEDRQRRERADRVERIVRPGEHPRGDRPERAQQPALPGDVTRHRPVAGERCLDDQRSEPRALRGLELEVADREARPETLREDVHGTRVIRLDTAIRLGSTRPGATLLEVFEQPGRPGTDVLERLGHVGLAARAPVAAIVEGEHTVARLHEPERGAHVGRDVLGVAVQEVDAAERGSVRLDQPRVQHHAVGRLDRDVLVGVTEVGGRGDQLATGHEEPARAAATGQCRDDHQRKDP